MRVDEILKQIPMIVELEKDWLDIEILELILSKAVLSIGNIIIRLEVM